MGLLSANLLLEILNRSAQFVDSVYVRKWGIFCESLSMFFLAAVCIYRLWLWVPIYRHKCYAMKGKESLYFNIIPMGWFLCMEAAHLDPFYGKTILIAYGSLFFILLVISNAWIYTFYTEFLSGMYIIYPLMSRMDYLTSRTY